MKRLTVLGLFLILPLGFGLNYLAHAELTMAARMIILSFTLTVIVGLVMWLVTYAYILLEKAKTVRARRQEAQRDASVMVITAGRDEQVYVREDNGHAVYRPLHLNPLHYQNGKPGEPTPLELASYQLWHSRPAHAPAPSPLLLDGPQMRELLPMLDTIQRCLIVGASDTGKTTLLRHIVSRRLMTSEVVVIDPHAYPGKWPGCKVIGVGRNYEEIDKTLKLLVKLMTKRYDDIGKGLVVEMGHSRLTVLIDEWRAIVFNVKGADSAIKTLLTESRKAAFSVFVASHSERVRALGIEGEGDLKDGFAVIRLSLVNGQRQATIDTGNGEQPVILPGPYLGSQPRVIDSSIDLEAEPDPTPEEQRILELKAEGLSNRDISQAVWGDGKFGQFYNAKIEIVLSKYGEK